MPISLMKFTLGLALSLALLGSSVAWAELDEGATAPDFNAEAALAGHSFRFSLSEALSRGPVVLYFFPAAFTPGCTVEAHEFAEASEQFAALGVTLAGISTDSIETLQRFSVSECRNKFAVIADTDATITQSYDAVMEGRSGYAARVSYVISPEGKILYGYEDGAPSPHIRNSLAAVRAWKQQWKQQKP